MNIAKKNIQRVKSARDESEHTSAERANPN